MHATKNKLAGKDIGKIREKKKLLNILAGRDKERTKEEKELRRTNACY